MSPDEIIDQALAELVRPDLVTVARGRFYNALQRCHSAARLTRDLETVVLEDFTLQENRVNFFLNQELPRFREVLDIKLFQNITMGVPSEEIPLCRDGFVNRNSLITEYDYYGFQIPQIYTIAGNQLQLQGVDNNTAAITIQYLTWPEFEIDPNTGELTSNSWILDEFPFFVLAQLKNSLAQITSDKNTIAAASRNIMLERWEFVRSMRGEILDA